jgi:hypothetical protein
MAVALCQQRLTAIKSHGQELATVTVNGVSYTLAQATAIYQACLDDRTDVDGKKAAVTTAIAKRRSDDGNRRSFDRGLAKSVGSQFGEESQVYADLGFPKSKPRKVTSEVKAQAAQKARQTRKQNNTLGKKQRKTQKSQAQPPAQKPSGS